MLKVDTACMEEQVRQMNEIARQLNSISSCVDDVNRQLRWNVNVSLAVRTRLNNDSGTISTLDNKASKMANVLADAVTLYTNAEKHAKKEANIEVPGESKNFLHIDEDWFSITWGDLLKYNVAAVELFYKALSTLEDYLKIGNAVGVKQTTVNWLKNVVDWKVDGHWSVAKDPVTNFIKNFTNKTSPIRNYLKNACDDLFFKNGIGNAVVSWAGIVVDGLVNWVDNKGEQLESGGMMSDGRVWAETIMETGVETVMTYAAGAVATAAIAAGATAAGATVAIPAAVVTVIGVATVGAVNGITYLLTGETATEHISDEILDWGEGVIESIGKWFKGLSFA